MHRLQQNILFFFCNKNLFVNKFDTKNNYMFKCQFYVNDFFFLIETICLYQLIFLKPKKKKIVAK